MQTTEQLRFKREIYVLDKMVTLMQEEYASASWTEFKSQFFLVRSLELFYRSLEVLRGHESDKQMRDLVALVCFNTMLKLHNPTFLAVDYIFDCLRELNSIPRDILAATRAIASEEEAAELAKTMFLKKQTDTEYAILQNVKWDLVPRGMIKQEDELVFHESWRYGGQHGERPADFRGPRSERVMKNLKLHRDNIKIACALGKIASQHDFPGFLGSPTEAVCDKLRPLHAGMVKLCKADSVFAYAVLYHCNEKEKLAIPLHMAREDLDRERRPEKDLSVIRREMVADLADDLSQELITLRLAAQNARASVLFGRSHGVSEAEFERVRQEVAAICQRQNDYQALAQSLQEVHHGSLRTCRHLLKSVDDLTTETLQKLKLSAEALRERQARMLPPESRPSATKFTRVTIETSRMMTRVQSDPFKTPATGVKHKVTILNAPRKVVRTTFQSDHAAGTARIVRVDVQPTFVTACELAAANYEAKCMASETAEIAATAAEAERAASEAEAAQAETAASQAASLASAAAATAAAAAAVEASHALVLLDLESEGLSTATRSED